MNGLALRPSIDMPTSLTDPLAAHPDVGDDAAHRDVVTDMRIAQVHSADGGGGAELTARLHHEELLRRGLHARFLVARRRHGGQGIEQIEFIRGPKGLLRTTRWIERKTGLQYLYSPSYRALLRRLPEDFDVVHIHSLHGAEGYADIGPIAALARRCPVVMSVHDLWLATGHCGLPLECTRWQTGCGHCPDLQRFPPIPRDATRWNWRRKQRALQSANVHLILPSQWVAEQLQHSPILRHLPSTVVHAPIDTSVFYPTDRRAAREARGLPQDRRIVVLTAQSLTNVYKGMQEGVQALNRIDDDRLFIVAIGRDADAVLNQCRAPGVAVPYQSDQCVLADYYRAADVFLMPSRSETFGMVAAEALACGTPAVAFAAGGLTDVLGNNEGGLLVPPGDVPALASAVALLLNDSNQQRQLGIIGAARAAREFSLAQHTRRCLDVYSRLIAARASSQN